MTLLHGSDAEGGAHSHRPEILLHEEGATARVAMAREFQASNWGGQGGSTNPYLFFFSLNAFSLSAG